VQVVEADPQRVEPGHGVLAEHLDDHPAAGAAVSAATNGGRSTTLCSTWWQTTTSARPASAAASGQRPWTARNGTPRAAASAGEGGEHVGLLVDAR
jgi:hypothetical protein